MPAKLNMICYVHNIAKRLTQDFTVKEITGITRTKNDDPTKDAMDGLTTKTVMNINGYLTLNFYVEESLGNCELTEFWVEARHDSNNRYLANKTNSINQNMRSTTVILVGSNNNRSYHPPQGATSRRRGRTTLAQMESTNTQNLSAALEANPIPTNMNQIPNNEISEENDN
ncbi:hypothetical protein GLOIN_2v1789421 [Rhizophagus irregularis DAOM 181602=DAOM 197198]|uniref:Uncharacterized protein n=1 Tax=Rhizophagus irregularis (strain DAOM 181602 / DAOM 197198 / MUCL 43194) TaxID=747089 RepID=A0A2P4P1E1_RHIID|nr:hypothetical protein GLOIN_2v1789421 [Rhizophagus irregularis DAOM 181602=DAOM 197198]POG59203.1 hypothetical protein GLOIN_2v1789421 [Rhizophagus irregularis DAOM 181602=DAOM 197198]|eukprot:XP_025166069.1 hypothetical protein GLOIN_2v1789421 [Rhizophagus irregularis DAOM 181602=DAOM 197198]